MSAYQLLILLYIKNKDVTGDIAVSDEKLKNINEKVISNKSCQILVNDEVNELSEIVPQILKKALTFCQVEFVLQVMMFVKISQILQNT